MTSNFEFPTRSNKKRSRADSPPSDSSILQDPEASIERSTKSDTILKLDEHLINHRTPTRSKRRKGFADDEGDEMMGIDDEDEGPSSTYLAPITREAGRFSTYGEDIEELELIKEISYMKVGNERDMEVDEELNKLAKSGAQGKSMAARDKARAEWTMKW